MNPGRLQEWCEVLTLTWMHSLWQGAVVGLGVAVLRGILCWASASVRYLVALLGLGVFASSVLITGILVAERMAPVSEVPVAERGFEVSAQVPRSKAEEVPQAVPLNLTPPELLMPESHPSVVDVLEPVLATAGLWPRMRSLALAWAPWIVGLWMGGTSILALRFCVSWFGLRRLRREGVRPASKRIQAQLEHLGRKLGVRAAVRVMESTLVLTPIIIGWAKPLILLPAGMACGLSSQQMEAILLHELAHIRRHDFLTNVVQRVIEAVLFYHPAVWYLSGRIRLEREHGCDDLAAEACGDRVRYAAVLTLVEEFRQSGELALGIGRKPLVTRIQRLLRPAPRRPLPVAAALGVLIAGLVATFAWWPSSSTAQESKVDVDDREADASLYAVVEVAEDQDLWQVDFHEGIEIGREMIMKVRDFEASRRFPALHRDRYAISRNGAIIDLENQRVVRRPNGGLVGVTENQVFCTTSPSNISQVSAFDLTTLTEQTVLLTDRAGILSPGGDWLLDRMDGTSKAPKLIRLADELTVNCPIEPVYYANPLSSHFLGPAMLWLDNETVLIGATNTDWITMNVFGEVEEIVTIPALDSARWFTQPNPRLGPHRLFRDPLGTVVYEAERAFAIDVETKTWRSYDWHQLGHEFSAKPDTCHWERAELRYGEESIGWRPASQRLAISDYLAVGDLAEISYWSTHTRKWTDLRMKSANVIGWVDHRAPSLPKAPVEVGGERRGQPLVVRDWGTYVFGGDEDERRHSIHVYGGQEGMKLNVAAGDGAESWELSVHKRADELPKITERAELREVSSRYLRTGTSVERFLSYQAPKRKAPATVVDMNELGVHFKLSAIHPEGIEPINVLAILNEGNVYRVALQWMMGVQTECSLSPEQFREADREQVVQLAQQLWRYTGATNAEAAALVKACEADLLETRGLLCIYPMTLKQLEADLPVSVDPAPTEIHRRVVVLEELSHGIPKD